MHITFLIGNGFDIALNLKTSYSNFYDWYCKQPSDIPHISEFRKDIDDDVNSKVSAAEKTWADFELGIGKYTSKFTKEEVEQYLECIDDAQEQLRIYLLEQEEHFNINAYSNQMLSEFETGIKEFYNEISELERPIIKSRIETTVDQDIEISFLTFNYTRTLEKIIEKLPDTPFKSWTYNKKIKSYRLNRNVLHIHGTNDEYPIVGVNDISQISNKSLLEIPEFQNYLIKSNKIQELGRLWHIQAEQQISRSSIVCVYGMSLGDSDAKWWRKLVQWLKANSSRHLVIFWYAKIPTNGVKVNLQLRYLNEAKNKLLSYTKLSPSEIENLKKQIHVVVNSSSFLRLETDVSKYLKALAGNT